VITPTFTDFCPVGCYRPIKYINLHAKFSQKSLILSKKVNLKKKFDRFKKHHFAKKFIQNLLIIPLNNFFFDLPLGTNRF